MKIGLRSLPVQEDFSSCNDFWLIVCMARSNSGELDRDSTHFYTFKEHSASSSSTTASY
jgi:hypothetical protein